ncbi:hypothetical protein AOA60_12650, partial [Pseudomonas sp. 2822-17]
VNTNTSTAIEIVAKMKAFDFRRRPAVWEIVVQRLFIVFTSNFIYKNIMQRRLLYFKLTSKTCFCNVKEYVLSNLFVLHLDCSTILCFIK